MRCTWLGRIFFNLVFFCKEKFWCWQASARQPLNVILKGHMAGLGEDESEVVFYFQYVYMHIYLQFYLAEIGD